MTYPISDVTRRIIYSGSAGTGPYSFSFEVLEQTDIAVYRNTTLLTLTTDYTVTISGSGTGSITLVVAATSADTVTLVGDRAIERNSDFVTGGDFFANTLNDELDSQTIFSQQIDEKANRSIKAPVTDPTTIDMTLPSKADRADAVLTFDTNGNPQATSTAQFISGLNNSILGANYTTTAATGDGATVTFAAVTAPGSKGNVQVYIDGAYQNKDTFSISGFNIIFTEAPPLNSDIEFVVGYAIGSYDGADDVVYTPAGTGAVATTVQAKLRESVSVKDFGAVGDGVADDTAAIQAAIDHLDGLGGGILNVPEGIYGITETVFVKSNITVQGVGRPEIKAIATFVGAMIQFGYTTAAINLPDTNPCSNSEVNNLKVNGDYKVTAKDWDPTNLVAATLESGLVYVWRDSPYNKIIDCKIHSAECGLLDSEDGSDFLVVSGCEIHGAISTSAATQYINLMNIDGSSNALIQNNKVYDLTISGYSPASWGYALRLHATDYATVSGNSFASGYNVVLIDGRSNQIENNHITIGDGERGIYLYENTFKCRYNTIVSNYVECANKAGIVEQTSADVELNVIAFNTIKDSTSGVVLGTSSGSRSFANNVYDTSDVLQADSGTVSSGTWSPAAINNTTNTASTAITNAQYSRVGNIVFISGVATTTLAAPGTYEFRFDPPIASTFSAVGDAIGTANDNFSSYGNFSALTSGTPRVIRVQGTATGAGAKTIRFTGSYIVK